MIQAGDAVMARLHCLMVTALFKAALQQQSQPGTLHAAPHAVVQDCACSVTMHVTVQDLKPN